ncbi:MAG: hypothetical protein JOY71_22580 [Acetobacteraceae bacterium]|nr:hypothetical protein [Acetobacteraceae bacterium]
MDPGAIVHSQQQLADGTAPLSQLHSAIPFTFGNFLDEMKQLNTRLFPSRVGWLMPKKPG